MVILILTCLVTTIVSHIAPGGISTIPAPKYEFQIAPIPAPKSEFQIAPVAAPAPGGTPATGLAGNGFEWSCAAIGKTDYGWKCIEYAKPK
jgi:hypothetical protein